MLIPPVIRGKDLTFPAQLKAKLELVRTDPKHLPARSVSGYRSFIDWGAVRVDDNNVDLEAEMVRLAEKQSLLSRYGSPTIQQY